MPVRLESLLNEAGVCLDGNAPWDLRTVHPGLARRVLLHGSLGLGEAYMDGWWDCDQLDVFFDRLLRSPTMVRRDQTAARWQRWRALQSPARAWHVGRYHYDLGNDFFAAMLDSRMTYTCAYWQQGATDLDTAQTHKLDLVCRKLGLMPGMQVLDIGCGWGSFMQYAALHYGVECVGVTISQAQRELGQKRCAGLPVEFRLADYRSVHQRFDRIVSLGMFEHVGPRFYATYLDVARRCLATDGLFLLHTIGSNTSGWGTDPWIEKYIFPNGALPSIAQIGRACERRFVVEDLHNFGPDYDTTLLAWHARFEAAWPQFAASLGERFHRMWRYYLLACAGAFRARRLQLWQWVLSPQGHIGAYRRPPC